jgi:hypothetical protein
MLTSSSSASPQRIFFTRSDRAGIRAGFGNMLIPIAICTALIAVLAIRDIAGSDAVGYLAGAAAIGVWAWVYLHVACSFSFSPDDVTVARSLDTLTWRREDIESVRMFRMNSNVSCAMLVKRRDASRPDFLFWVTPQSNVGSFKETCAAIEFAFGNGAAARSSQVQRDLEGSSSAEKTSPRPPSAGS